MKVLDKLGRFGGLDLSNLVGAEVAFRRLQLCIFRLWSWKKEQAKVRRKARMTR